MIPTGAPAVLHFVARAAAAAGDLASAVAAPRAAPADAPPPPIGPGGQVAAAAAPAPFSPAQALFDLRLPEEIKKLFESPLTELGFSLTDEEVMERFGQRSRQFTVARKNTFSRYLIHVPQIILSVYQEAHRDALATVPYDFQGLTLFIFSPPLDTPQKTLRKFLQEGWRAQGVRANFIPWQDVSQLQECDAERKRRDLTDMLDLKNEREKGGVIELEQKDKNDICDVLVEHPAFDSARDRETLASQAGLKRILPGFEYSGKGRTVAGDILDRLEGHGWLTSEKHALGALLEYICALKDTPPDAAKRLKEIIEAYKLSSTPP